MREALRRMRRPTRTAALLIAGAIGALLPASALAACATGDPSGRYTGSVTSAQAGRLDATLNLRCAGGAYAGVLATSVGRFAIRDGGFANGSLHLTFDGGDAIGTIDLRPVGDHLTGGFRLHDDLGPVALDRVGDAAPTDSFDVTMALTPAQWREDLAWLASELPRRHASAFHRISRAAFDEAVARLRARIDRLNPDQIYVEFDRLATMIGDGHTYVIFPPDDANLPLSVKAFDGAYRIVAAGADDRAAIGASLVAIDGMPVAEAARRLIAITPRDETPALREGRVETFLTLGMMLHGAGISRSRDDIAFTLRDDAGRVFTERVHAVRPGEAVAWRSVAVQPPLYRQHRGESFWCTTPAPQTLYCNFRGYDQLADRARDMFARIAQARPDKLVIDMRGNSGGDFNLGLHYVVDPIAADPLLNRPGHLFVLMDEAIFSAGMSNTAQFRTRTHAILVGEPIGERPNTYQEARETMLPNSHLILRYSTRFYRFVDHGPNIVAPDRTIATHWADYRNGRDPVLDWVLHQGDARTQVTAGGS
jgi:hypothetical protein